MVRNRQGHIQIRVVIIFESRSEVLVWAQNIGKQYGIICVNVRSDNANGQLRSAPSGSGWKVMVRCGFHNHKLYEDLDDHDILGHLKVHDRRFVNDRTKYNMTPRYIVFALKDKDPGNLTSVTQVYKARATYNASKRVKLLNMFHLVLIFDCTYKTDRYRLPLLRIVGVMSTKLTFSVGFTYLEYEREENFKWVLEKLKELFSYEKLLSNVMVTDQELALMNAIEVVFPNSTYMLCLFHFQNTLA
ncbi:uncharacterized protein LOC127122139 [Lathyrus oleraceus]|uniref:uncharacterized protein LOC127122139 n=1 Tax=Pisum sativum TaxID=3888 RepID=UPI0021CFA0A7|nr:uncharacterized protein LOC127122139 [Pisum sativum]